MDLPSSPALQRLRRLNKSLSGFHEQLHDVLCGEEYKQCVPNLPRDDLVWLVDHLDKVLDILDPTSSVFRKCRRELRRICGGRVVLPASYTISSHLLDIGANPFAAGGFGDVYRGTFDGSNICVKLVRVYTKGDPQKATKTFCKEAVLWKRLSHPNILPLLGVTITPLQLVSEWVSGGDLREYVGKNPEADRLRLLLDIAKGLCYLHSCNIVHGDLKGTNILVDNSGHARIADFGLAPVVRDLDFTRSAAYHHGQTARWAAPEILNGGECSKEADIFSLAMVTIEVFTGAVPFSGGSSARVRLAIMQGKRPQRPTHPIFTEGLWTMTQRCWDHRPHMRPEISEVLHGVLTLDPPTWKRLISYPLSARERTSLITTISSDHDQIEMVKHLTGDDAQTFVNIIDEALDDLTPNIRGECLRYLYKICARQALLPRSLVIPLCYDPAETPHYRDVRGDVWKGQYCGRGVAANVLRTCSTSDLERITKRFCREVVIWRTLQHPNVLPLLGVTMTENRLVMVSEWMENGNINEFVKTLADVNRLELLKDATKGLIYMHDLGIIHGSIRGTSILIDNNGRACLAGFGPLTLASDQSAITPSRTDGGTIRWMSPELIDPGTFGLKETRPTKESDCYALGMVIYEVLSGRTPFAPCNVVAVISKVLRGERPNRPQGWEAPSLTDNIWEMLELCWKPSPRDRISAKDVLRGLGVTSPPPEWTSNMDGVAEADTNNPPYATASEFGPGVAHGDDELPAPPRGYLKAGWVGDWLVRFAWKVIRVATKQLHVL